MGKYKSQNKKGKHKVFIVDDHPLVRQGLALIINQQTDLTVCGEAGDVSQALSSIADCKPDIAIVDLTLENSSGIRLIEELMHHKAGLSVLVFSMHDESIYAERCLKAGAKGYIMKQEPPAKVLVALRKILNGDIYVSESLGERLLHKIVGNRVEISNSPFESLSNRELEVYQLIGRGLRNREIAEELHLSVKTIETYMEHIKKKMDFKNFHEIIMHAARNEVRI
jgi:DNA-binding NarL/FixJ family response regulator